MDVWGSPLSDDETRALEALGRDELALFARLHTRCLLEMDGPKRLTPILNQMAGMSFDQLDALIELYHQHYPPFSAPDGGQLPASGSAGFPDCSPPQEASTDQPCADPPGQGPDDPKAPVWCPVCEIMLNGKTQYEDHLAGRKHAIDIHAECHSNNRSTLLTFMTVITEARY